MWSTTLHQGQLHSFLFFCYVLLDDVPPFIISSLRILFVRNSEVLLPNFLWSTTRSTTTGWWFQSFLEFSIIYGIILPIDWYFSIRLKPPTRFLMDDICFFCDRSLESWWTYRGDKTMRVPYFRWVKYDSLHQFTQKMDLTVQNGYGVIESSHFNEAIYFPEWI